MLSNLPKAIQLVSGKGRIQPTHFDFKGYVLSLYIMLHTMFAI